MKNDVRAQTIVHVITSLNQGGAQAMLLKLIVASPRCYHTHVISLMDEGMHGQTIRELGITLHCMNMKRGSISLRTAWRLRNLLKAIQPDVVQTWMYHADLIGGLAAKCIGTPKIFWNVRHGNLDRKRNSLSTCLTAYTNALLSHILPTGIVINSSAGLKVHKKIGYKFGKMIVIPNAIDLSIFNKDNLAREQFRTEIEVDQNIFVFGMAARFDPQKDHQVLLHAARIVANRINNFKLVLCGSGMTSHNVMLQNAILECRLETHVQLLGIRSDMVRFMNALDVHVLSSYGEGFPNVIGEAMACHVPCVTTDAGDAAEIVGDTGWVVPKGDPNALAEAMLFAISEPSAIRIERGLRCRERILRHYDISYVAKIYHSLWNQIFHSKVQ